MRFGRRARLRRLLRRGDAARDARAWNDAAAAYSAALAMDPQNAPIRIQLGHSLKESGQRAAAEAAYRAATAGSDPADAWFQLACLLAAEGRAIEAIEAFRFALEADPNFRAAADALVALGARDAIPDTVRLSAAARAGVADALAEITEASRRLGELASLAVDPARGYHAFRSRFPIAPPPRLPGAKERRAIAVRIDARQAIPAMIYASLNALIDQADGDWCCTVVTDAANIDHPVASRAAIDPRIRFTAFPTAIPDAGGPILFMRAGTVLDPQALAWLGFAAGRSGCAAAYADHDHGVDEWRETRRHTPAFQPCFDPDWFSAAFDEPAIVYVAESGSAGANIDMHYGGLLCRIAAAGGGVAHVPRVLATKLDLPATAMVAPLDPARVTPQVPPRPEAQPSSATERDAPIAVIIPTRDQAELLARCIDSLLQSARDPATIEIIIVDNRSVESETAVLLARLAAVSQARTLAMDEPFNWSRANNLAVAATSAPILVFLNNDTQMLTPHWDARAREWLRRGDVGIVGGRLLYPDRTVQHAGVLFGMNAGSPMHEGVGAAEADPGPGGRWLRPRSAAAVTGAFMAMRREVWRTAGGFDADRLPIAFNDIDMCLKVRTAKLRVVYAPDLVLTHHESKTRGRNVTRAQVAWDQSELRSLHLRWGAALLDDPGLNPHWSRYGHPFDGYREPGLREILRHIDRSAGQAPWVPMSPEDSDPSYG